MQRMTGLSVVAETTELLRSPAVLVPQTRFVTEHYWFN